MIPCINAAYNFTKNVAVSSIQSNCVIDGYSTPYRLDRNSNGGGILLYIRVDISSHLISTEKVPVESFYTELDLRNEKYLIYCTCNSQETMINNPLATLERILDLHSSKYEKDINTRRLQHRRK